MPGLKKVNKKALELFCGTKSFTKALKRYGCFDTTTLDINPIFKPDILTDILNCDFSPASYDLIWASPPCQCFSVISAKYYWRITKENGKKIYSPKRPATIRALTIIDKTVAIISRCFPRYWFIENPRGILQFVIGDIFQKYGIRYYYKRTVTYCKYGEAMMKPTNIWTNFAGWVPRPHCIRGDKCHEYVNKENKRKTGTIGLPDAIHRGVVPEQLCEEIAESIMKSIRGPA